MTGGAGAGATSYAYDNANRLTQVGYPGGTTIGYAYDAAGQRVTDTTNGVPATNTYDAAGRMTALGATTYTYDANGRRTGKTAGGVTTTYTYDALGRVSGISAPGLSASYTYNGDGQRTRKTVNGQATAQAWDVLTGRPLTGSEYIHDTGGTVLGAAEGAGVTQYQNDAAGSPELVTDSSGATQGTTNYGVLGDVQASGGAQPALGAGGAVRDDESGLLFDGREYGDPATGVASLCGTYYGCDSYDTSKGLSGTWYAGNSASLYNCNPTSGACALNPAALPPSIVHGAISSTGCSIFNLDECTDPIWERVKRALGAALGPPYDVSPNNIVRVLQILDIVPLAATCAGVGAVTGIGALVGGAACGILELWLDAIAGSATAAQITTSDCARDTKLVLHVGNAVNIALALAPGFAVPFESALYTWSSDVIARCSV